MRNAAFSCHLLEISLNGDDEIQPEFNGVCVSEKKDILEILLTFVRDFPELKPSCWMKKVLRIL